MALKYRVHAPEGAQPRRWAFILHGFLGQGRNWDFIARRLAERRPDYGVVTPDLRLHGGSQDVHPPHDLAACARDLAQLAEALGGEVAAVMGHSFGGKVALTWQKQGADLRQLWVLDSTPRPMVPQGSAWAMLPRLRAIPLPARNRREVVDRLTAEGLSTAEAQWVVSNLARGEEGFVWGVDLDALEVLVRDFYPQDLWPTVDAPGRCELHFVRATRSTVMSQGDVDRIKELGAQGRAVHLHELDSGHWVNVGDPEGLLSLFERHLPR